MMNITAPVVARLKLVLAVGVLSLTFLGGWYVNGLRWEADYQSLKTSHAESLAEAQASARKAAEDALDKYAKFENTISTIDKQRYQEAQDAKKANDDRWAALVSGNQRLSVLITKSLPVSGSTNPQVPSVDSGGEKADLDPRVAGNLVRLTGRGDQAIIQLSACQDILRVIESGDQKALSEALGRYQKPSP